MRQRATASGSSTKGADFRNYTYAKYGREILQATAAQFAFQIFDAKVADLLRDEYKHPRR